MKYELLHQSRISKTSMLCD